MPLDRITSSFSHGKEQAERSARANLELMLKYPKAFNHIKGGADYLAKVKSMSGHKEKFTPKQLSYINECIYEKFMTGLGKSRNDEAIIGASSKHDIKFGLKF